MDSKVYSGPEILAAPMETMVCYCSGVSKGQVLRAMGQVLRAMEDRARTLEDIKALTTACTVAKCKELSPRRR